MERGRNIVYVPSPELARTSKRRTGPNLFGSSPSTSDCGCTMLIVLITSSSLKPSMPFGCFASKRRISSLTLLVVQQVTRRTLKKGAYVCSRGRHWGHMPTVSRSQRLYVLAGLSHQEFRTQEGWLTSSTVRSGHRSLVGAQMRLLHSYRR